MYNINHGYEVYSSYLQPNAKVRGILWLVFGSSTINSSTRDSSIIFALQLLTASHKQLRGVLGAEPPVLAFSLRVLGLVSQEYDVLVLSL